MNDRLLADIEEFSANMGNLAAIIYDAGFIISKYARTLDLKSVHHIDAILTTLYETAARRDKDMDDIINCIYDEIERQREQKNNCIADAAVC